MAVIMWYSTWW